MTVELLTEHHLEFLSSKGGYTGSSESTLVKIPHCWKSRGAAQLRTGIAWAAYTAVCVIFLKVHTLYSLARTHVYVECSCLLNSIFYLFTIDFPL